MGKGQYFLVKSGNPFSFLTVLITKLSCLRSGRGGAVVGGGLNPSRIKICALNVCVMSNNIV